MRRLLGFPSLVKKGQAEVFDGLAWTLATVLVAAGGVALTPTKIPVMSATGLIDSQLAEVNASGIYSASYGGTFAVNAGVTALNTVVGASGSINDFLQFDIKNTSTGTSAQSTYSITADNGTLTSGFMSININNSTFTAVNAYSIGVANDCSILASGNDLFVANASATKDIIFSTGKAASPYFDERLRIQNASGVGGMLATLGNSFVVRKAATQDAIALAGRAGGTSSRVVTITVPSLTASRTFTLLDADVIAAGSASALTSGRITFAAASGLLSDSSLFQFAATGVTSGVGSAGAGMTINGSGNNVALIVTGAATQNRSLVFHTVGSVRWGVVSSAVAESGSNAGSPFLINAYDDAATFIDSPVSIIRAAGGLIALTRPTSITNTTSASSSIVGAFLVGNGSAATNVAIGGGNVNAGGTLTVGSLTSGRIPFAGTGGLLTDNSAFTYISNVLEISRNSAAPSLRLKQTSAATNSPSLEFYSGGGYRHQILEVDGAAGYLSFVSVDGTPYQFDKKITITDTTSASSSITGAFLVGNGVAATNVAIGGGNIFAGGNISLSGSPASVIATGGILRLESSSSTVDFRPNATFAGRFSAAGNLLINATADTGLTGAGGLRVNSSTSATSSIVGAVVIGDAATAATNVSFGAGNINAGGTGTFGGAITVTATSVSVISNNSAGAPNILTLRNTVAAALDNGPQLLFQGDTSVASSASITALWEAAANTNSYLAFSTRRAGTLTQAGRFNSAGNFLIGTSTDGMTAAGSLAITQDLAHRGTKAGFFNATPVTRPSMAAWSGTATRTTFSTITATLTNVAEAVKSIIDDLRAYGLEA